MKLHTSSCTCGTYPPPCCLLFTDMLSAHTKGTVSVMFREMQRAVSHHSHFIPVHIHSIKDIVTLRHLFQPSQDTTIPANNGQRIYNSGTSCFLWAAGIGGTTAKEFHKNTASLYGLVWDGLPHGLRLHPDEAIQWNIPHMLSLLLVDLCAMVVETTHNQPW